MRVHRERRNARRTKRSARTRVRDADFTERLSMRRVGTSPHAPLRLTLAPEGRRESAKLIFDMERSITDELLLPALNLSI